MPAYDEDTLHGQWTHSHEEDTPREMVFRRPTHPFPLSRGRLSIDLNEDGTYTESAPGPVDAPVQSQGSWALEGDRLLLAGSDDHPGHAWKITGAEHDRLVVQR